MIPKKIQALAERFEEQKESYKSGKYNETLLRQDFLNPLLKELGWDVDNEQGHAEAYREVIHEDAVKVGSATKAPDYSCRIGGMRKFFVEAKKPSVHIKGDPAPAYQLRRYAWSAKLPISILTDFEEFAVYDCRQKPKPTDSAAVGRIFYCTYDQYAEHWDHIQSIFSKDAILKGSFDKYAEEATKKRGTAEVDDEFLKEIESWRDLLAKNIALRNPKITEKELNYAVQKTIDRLIFLRICEDRGIEDYSRLLAEVNGTNIYGRLKKHFKDADAKYNSGLFHFQEEKDITEPADTWTLGLNIDDSVLKKIISHLYYPESPYEFSVLPADLLGHVYEQFLGKVIRLTAGHRAKIEEKPEVRKAGGVYYTPTYIVQYIVEQTVGKLLEGKTPKQAEKLRIVDPACGSGSFLLGAYQKLLDWHLLYYTEHEPTKWKKELYRGTTGDWKLTTAERKRILLNNIYGVDLDSQAAEVTKLSLLLKVLEGENEQTLGKQLSMFKERALPSLSSNIKCGNSLIGTDFYNAEQTSLLQEVEAEKVNAFDWETEFAEVFKQGGFDAVIGNPPYVRQELLGIQKPYFEKHYKVYHGVADLYVYFFERGYSLLKQEGIFGIIVANKWMRANYGKPLRKWLKQAQLLEVTDFGDLPVFQGATTYPCIIRILKGKASKQFTAAVIDSLDFTDLREYVSKKEFDVQSASLDDDGWALIGSNEHDLLEKIKGKGTPLCECIEGKIYRGVLTGLNEAFVIDQEKRDALIREDKKSAELIKPFCVGRDIKRYQSAVTGKYIILVPRGYTNAHKSGDAWQWFSKTYPAIAEHLAPFEERAKKRFDQGEYWWELRACDYYDAFEKPKIMFPDIAQRLNFALDDHGTYCANTAYFLPTDDLYLLGILNSSLIDFVYRNISSSFRGGYLRAFKQYLDLLPIRESADKKIHDHLASLVKRIIDLNQRNKTANTPHEKDQIKRQISAIDREIDEVVFELYELSDREKKIVVEMGNDVRK